MVLRFRKMPPGDTELQHTSVGLLLTLSSISPALTLLGSRGLAAPMAMATVSRLYQTSSLVAKSFVISLPNAVLGQSLDRLSCLVGAEPTKPLLHLLEHLVLDVGLVGGVVGVVERFEDLRDCYECQGG